MISFVGVALSVLEIIIAFIILLLLLLVADYKMTPKFPCVACRYYHGNRKCSVCVDGVDGEPRLCTGVRGSLGCLRRAKRR